MGLAYRVQQFIRSLTAQVEAAEYDRAEDVLDPRLHKLFSRMPPSDQAHALRVLSSLQRASKTEPDLLAAALLHDVGKSIHPPSVFDRVIVVIANRLVPRKVVQWGGSEPRGWRRPFAIAVQHPEWGADLAAQHGASDRLVELIRRHQESCHSLTGSEIERMLADLSRADSEN